MGRILIAEDDQDVAQTLVEGLEAIDYEVTGIIARGEDLYQAVKLHQPELILVDIYLAGELDGIEATKPFAELQKPPIIFLTGNFKLSLIARLKEHQNAMLLYKPCKIPELVANIEMALERQRRGEPPFNSLFSSSNGSMESEDFRRQLGLLIKATRKEKLMTQANAAEKLSVNYRYFQDIEAGKANLKIDTLFKILKGLDIVE